MTGNGMHTAKHQAPWRLACGLAALLVTVSGCGMLDTDGKSVSSRRVPTLNPGGKVVLLGQAEPSAGGTQSSASAAFRTPVAQTPPAPVQAPTAVPKLSAQPIVYQQKREEEGGMFSWMPDWFSDDEAEIPPVMQDNRPRYTPLENVAILHQENNDRMADQSYPELAAVPAAPVYEDPVNTANRFGQMEAERVHAETVRQQMVAGAPPEDIATQMQSAELYGFVEATPDEQGFMPPPPAIQVAPEVASEIVLQAPPPPSPSPVQYPVQRSVQQPMPQPAVVQPAAVQPMQPPIVQQPVAMAMPQAQPAQMVEPAMDAYTAEILGERILPLEETQLAAQPQPVAAIPQPLHTHTHAAQAMPVMQPPPAPLPFPETAHMPVEAPPLPEAAMVEEITPVAEAEAGYLPEDDTLPEEYYSYYEDTLRLRPPQPIARQTMFLPESRYAKRRVNR